MVFACAFAVRVALGAVFLGSNDNLSSIAYVPMAARHVPILLPYFPVIVNILGTSGLVARKTRLAGVAARDSLEDLRASHQRSQGSSLSNDGSDVRCSHSR